MALSAAPLSGIAHPAIREKKLSRFELYKKLKEEREYRIWQDMCEEMEDYLWSDDDLDDPT